MIEWKAQTAINNGRKTQPIEFPGLWEARREEHDPTQCMPAMGAAM
ncbi:unnamed protein product [Strongylus vulgaris]|uniref:Uncharacterized protein n=1 Tax=Strongylus vulgaris TaxID=40348 RepID=A0A3P7JCS7_STRVU|nr:unnamed protein product [Strongylus vulgaris]